MAWRRLQRVLGSIVIVMATVILGAPPAGASTPVFSVLPVVAAAGMRDGSGYWLLYANGGVRGFGAAQWHGDPAELRLNAPVVDIAATPSGKGYWVAAADGGVFAYGDAPFYGSRIGLGYGPHVTGIVVQPDGRAYTLVESSSFTTFFASGEPPVSVTTVFCSVRGPCETRGRTQAAPGPKPETLWLQYDAATTPTGVRPEMNAGGSLGDVSSLRLNQPVVNIDSISSGAGYWLVAGDGGVFAFGDARFLGSAANLRLNRPVVEIQRTQTGNGYWLFAADGGVFAYGDAPFHGSAVLG